jgi:hypothetical protein
MIERMQTRCKSCGHTDPSRGDGYCDNKCHEIRLSKIWAAVLAAPDRLKGQRMFRPDVDRTFGYGGVAQEAGYRVHLPA